MFNKILLLTVLLKMHGVDCAAVSRKPKPELLKKIVSGDSGSSAGSSSSHYAADREQHQQQQAYEEQVRALLSVKNLDNDENGTVEAFLGGPINSQKRLFRDLFSDYDNRVRPVADDETVPVVVRLGLDLQQIIDVDERNQLLHTNVWLKMEWPDYGLEWDPDYYGGIREIRVSASDVWRPDILLYNSASEEFDSTFHTNVVINYTGNVVWIPPGIVRSTCKIDILWFPFDDQRCEMKFGSWTHGGNQIDLRLGEVRTSTFMQNGEWLLLGVPSVRNEFKYDCCPDPYYDVTFTLWMRRRTLYYGFNLLIPCVLISAMTLLCFTLPVESGEKLTLGVTILLSLCVFQLLVAQVLPSTSDAVPLIVTYFTCIMILVSASVLFTVIVLSLYHKAAYSTTEMSPMTKRVLLHWLPCLLLMRRAPAAAESESHLLSSENASIVSLVEEKGQPLKLNAADLDRYALQTYWSNLTNRQKCVSYQELQSPTWRNPLLNVVRRHVSSRVEFREILDELRFITKRMRKADETEDMINDWRFAAMVIDRLCLIAFAGLLVGSTLGIFFAAPHIVA